MQTLTQIVLCHEDWREKTGFKKHVYRDKAGHVWVQRFDGQYVAKTNKHGDDERGVVVPRFTN